MRPRRIAPVRALGLLLLVAAFAAPVRAVACDNERSADRAMIEAQRAADRAQRNAERIVEMARRQAELAQRRAEWAAEHASESAQRAAERAQQAAEQAVERAEREVERTRQRAEHAVERAAVGSDGVVVTNNALLFVDGPEVPRDEVEWADDVRSRRASRPTSTDTVISVSPGVTLSLSNRSGNIEVQVWDRDEVRIQAEHDRTDQLVANQQDATLKLGVRARYGDPADVDWTLTVPVWLPLELSGMESDIDVTGLRAPVTAKSMRGDVRVSACQGPLDLYSVEGDVRVEDVTGSVSATSMNSDVSLVRVIGQIQAQSINGDIQMESVSSSGVSASTMNGKVYYASGLQPHGHYSLSSHNGKVYVGVDHTQPVNVTVSSFNGQVETSLPDPPKPPTPPAANSWNSWSFTIPAVPVSTDAPMAPAAPEAPPAGKADKYKFKFVRMQPPSAPRARLYLDSFGGVIRLASREDIQHAIELARAMADSAQATREAARLRQLNRIYRRGAPAPDARPAEAPPPPEKR